MEDSTHTPRPKRLSINRSNESHSFAADLEGRAERLILYVCREFQYKDKEFKNGRLHDSTMRIITGIMEL
ncbi:hypothetical protein J28TS4_33140 [Paenibacillus lautus]|nr:hypothetical protein J28TS4_33140 [Paenibacillus lautus]